ncbi:glycerate kinase type-2 family protein, partial [Nitratidesulfovibrio liaohensis]|uniref:glycerate kinase type-2 family protein n=1 Tax=Nitratidesulfovibrio liaohensis TaxID=2604158 RepID=UPI00141E7021
GPRDLVLCALTGGASALTPALQPGITLDDMRAATTLLLECGATIHEINALRKHLSAFGGGNLARAAAPAQVVSLIISDVVGDDLDVIASGPTSPDVSTYADCQSIADRFGILHRLPAPVVERLTAGLRGMAAETPKPGDPVFDAVQNCIVASNRLALEAAAEAAAAHGYRPRILTDTMTGEARVRARELVEEAASAAEGLPHPEGPFCLLAGGETTVTITGGGLGGRNQEMALAAAIRMDELADCQHIAMLCAGTDGTDGPTDAAGGYASGSTLCVARECGVDAHGHLADNDAYNFLDRTGHLLRTGPTLTNVMDLAVLLVDAPKGKPAA